MSSIEESNLEARGMEVSTQIAQPNLQLRVVKSKFLRV